MAFGEKFFGSAAKQVKLFIAFEVVDDPTDIKSTYLDYLKAVRIKFFFSSESEDIPLTITHFSAAQNIYLFPGISKQTPLQLRQFEKVILETESFYLYVLAEPTEGWNTVYDSRQYKFQVKSGQSYNVTVSLPLRPIAASSTPTPKVKTGQLEY